MFGLDQIVAWLLLAAPPALVDPLVQPAVFDSIRPVLIATAIQWEILDPRETRYVLARSDDFLSDLNLLRRRYQDLSRAPLLHDGLRFPDADAARQQLAFNRTYRQHLSIRQPIERNRGDELRAAARETDHLYTVWDTLRDARCEFYYVTVRRLALLKLREMLGDEDYYFGRVPPPVPVWRFQAMN
jgi:hypothetical protein